MHETRAAQEPVEKSLPRARDGAALALALALAGCGPTGPFATVDVPEPPGVDAAAWPRLVDAPPASRLRAQAPAPAEGARILEEMAVESAISAAEAERIAAPVFDVEALRRDAESLRSRR